MSFQYRILRYPNTNAIAHMVSIDIPWRRLPKFLETVSSVQYNIEKAQITCNNSVLFLTDKNKEYSMDVQRQILTMICDSLNTVQSTESTTDYMEPALHLSKNTRIDIYNVPQIPFTTIEFECKDRIGLLHDLMAYFASLPYDLHSAYISTVNGDIAHNLLHLQANNQPLTFNDMQYIQNVFGFEVLQDFEGASLETPLM